MRRLTPKRPSPSMVVALLALFVALGGSSYAAIKIGSKDIANNSVRGVDVKNGSLTGKDVKNNSLTGADVSESKLNTVPRAKAASTLGGKTATQLTVTCPAGTQRFEGACMETAPRSALNEFAASDACASVGRRLPTASELVSFAKQPNIALSNYEVSSNLYHESGNFRYIAVNDLGTLIGSLTNTARAYRCVASLSN